jgi:hypothetical protein
MKNTLTYVLCKSAFKSFLLVVFTLINLLIINNLKAGEYQSKIFEVQKVWDQAPHNAFTDLIRYKGAWYLTFREGKGHVSNDGALRILKSKTGYDWKSIAHISSQAEDLRDPKLAITPDNRLMISTAAVKRKNGNTEQLLTKVWFSSDGENWTKPLTVGDKNMWLWRFTWHKGVAYSLGYAVGEERYITLYRSDDGENFTTFIDRLFTQDYPNESEIIFLENDLAYCLLRRDWGTGTAQLGKA